MRKTIIKSFSKYYYLCISFVVILCYGFTLTNFSMGIDDEAFKAYFENNSLLYQGRWGYVILKRIFNSYEFLPLWRDLIAICLIVAGLTMFNFILKTYTNNLWNNTLSIIFTCISISFPYIASMFVFMMTTIETGMVYLLVSFSLHFYFCWHFKKKHWINLIYSIGTLTFAISFSETSPVIFLLIFFITCFLRTLITNEESKLTKVLLSILKIFILIFISIVFWEIVKIILQKILNVPNSSYVNNYITYNFSGVVPFLNSLKHFIVTQFNTIIAGFKLDYATKTVSLSIFVTLISIIFLAIKNKKISIFIYGICILISAFALSIVTGNPSLPHRALTCLSFLVSFAFCLLYIIFRNISIKKFKFKYIVLFLVIVNIFYQSKQMNRTFFIDYKGYQYDITMASQIYHDLKAVTDNNKVIFVGTPPDFNQVVEPSVGNSLFVWDRHELLQLELRSTRLYEFFKQHGYDIYPTEYDIGNLKTQINGMPNWPKTGSIKDCKDYTIIKLGKSFLEKC